MPIKNKNKKPILKKSSKKAAAAPAKKKIVSPVKKKKVLRAEKNVKALKDFEKFEELRDVVERLPEVPLPGAPKELPKDLPEENPTREPALMPAALAFKEAPHAALPVREAEKPSSPKIVYTAKPKGGHGVWVAVAATFSVIAVVWFTTLGSAFISPKGTDTKFEQEMKALSAEWQGAAATMKETFEAVTARMKTEGDNSAVPSGEVLQAVGARVIFEAAQAATSTEN